ncbi:YagU family protein [Dermabacteraceae bacterium P13115]|nr:YagU family protein [Dermabacteraceae bacterium TAE3-ERU5]
MQNLFVKTDPSRRRIGVALLVGVITGTISAIVKFGWEVPFPPRTPMRDMTNPPQALLELFGMSPDTSHLMVIYNGNERPIMSFLIHFSFAIAFGVIYCVAAEYYPGIKLWQGAAFGFLVWVVFHLLLMPAMGLVPPMWGQPFGEHFSECFGHIFWMWLIELTRRDLRNRITHEPDAEVPLSAATR